MKMQRTRIGWPAGLVLAGVGLLGPGFAGVSHGTTIQQDDAGYVAFQAESRDSTGGGLFSSRAWTEVDDSNAGASGDRAMLFDSDDLSEDNLDRDDMTYRINFSNTGSYDLYIRHRQSTTGSDNDTYGVGTAFDSTDTQEGNYIDNGTDYAYRKFESDPDSIVPNDYTVDQAGVHEFTVSSLDDGAYLDRLVFSREGDVDQNETGVIGPTPFDDGDGDDTVFARANSPIPEPASLALLGVGGLMLLPRRRKASG